MAEVVDAISMPSDPGAVSHDYIGTIIIRGQLQKVITCAANPSSIDWGIQNQSDAALSVRKEMEDLHSAPLSTAILPK